MEAATSTACVREVNDSSQMKVKDAPPVPVAKDQPCNLYLSFEYKLKSLVLHIDPLAAELSIFMCCSRMVNYYSVNLYWVLVMHCQVNVIYM